MLLFKQLYKLVNDDSSYETKFTLSILYNKYYIKKVIKKNKQVSVNLDNNNINIKNINKLPIAYSKKNNKKLIGYTVSPSTFLFKNDYGFFKAPYYSIKNFKYNKIFNIKKKMMQVLKSANTKRFTYIKIVFSNKGGYIVRTFSGIRGFLPRSHFNKSVKANKTLLKKAKNIRDFSRLKVNSYSKKYYKYWLLVKLTSELEPVDIFRIFTRKKKRYTKKYFHSNFVFLRFFNPIKAKKKKLKKKR